MMKIENWTYSRSQEIDASFAQDFSLHELNDFDVDLGCLGDTLSHNFSDGFLHLLGLDLQGGGDGSQLGADLAEGSKSKLISSIAGWEAEWLK